MKTFRKAYRKKQKDTIKALDDYQDDVKKRSHEKATTRQEEVLKILSE